MPHPARFPGALPAFFIKLLTKPGDVILDPFAGSNVTGEVAESLKRRWISIELDPNYVKGSKFRFEPQGDSKTGEKKGSKQLPFPAGAVDVKAK
jgi:site-specific DNA-methyltransferase (cytosine-N4-specific)